MMLQHGKHGLDLPLQSRDGKRLCDVVHRAGFITPQLIALLVIGGEEDDHRIGMMT